MSGIFGAIQTVKTSLQAHQRALGVVANNIANVNTPNYVRRRVIFEEIQSFEQGRLGGLGRGVEAIEVQRIFDRFVEAQITSERQTAGELDLKNTILGRVELIFDETFQDGLNSNINKMFIALQALADLPGGTTERVALIETAQGLATQFNRVDSDLVNLQRDMDNQVSVLIDEINRLTGEIASTNQSILLLETSGAEANDLRDTRDGLLKELSDKLAFRVFEDEKGLVTVLTNSGYLLVDDAQTFDLQATRKTSLNGNFAVEVVVGSNQTVDITSSLTQGRLGAIINLRDTLLPQYRGSVDELAAALVNEINVQHRLGTGLDGSTNADFFTSLSPTATPSTSNTGSATLSGASVTDFSTLTRDDYTIVFSVSGPTTYNVIREDTGASVASGTYTPGAAITFDGLSVTLTGAPNNGDSFTVSVAKGAAAKMAVDATLSTTPSRVAAGLSSAPGDNQNALSLLDLRTKKVLNFSQGSFQDNFEDFYGAFSTQVFLAKSNTEASLDQQAFIVDQLNLVRESTSGVSIDEEMVNLTKLEAGFQASVRVLDVLNQLFDEILNLL